MQNVHEFVVSSRKEAHQPTKAIKKTASESSLVLTSSEDKLLKAGVIFRTIVGSRLRVKGRIMAGNKFRRRHEVTNKLAYKFIVDHLLSALQAPSKANYNTPQHFACVAKSMLISRDCILKVTGKDSDDALVDVKVDIFVSIGELHY